MVGSQKIHLSPNPKGSVTSVNMTLFGKKKVHEVVTKVLEVISS